MIERAMTIREVAEYLHVDQKLINWLLSIGTLPGSKVAAAWRFEHSGIDAWIEERKQQSLPTTKGSTMAAPPTPLPTRTYDSSLAQSENQDRVR